MISILRVSRSASRARVALALKHVAVVREKESLARILRAHRLPVQAAPARAPPQTDLDFGP